MMWERKSKNDPPLWVVVVADVLGIETSSPPTQEDEKLQLTKVGGRLLYPLAQGPVLWDLRPALV